MSPSHPRRRSRGDGSLGPLSKEDQELQSVCRQISDLAPQKFTTVREAFRYLRPDRNGMASRSDILYFLRAYGVEEQQASRVYERFDPDEVGSIDCCQFVDFMRPHVAPDGDDMELIAGLTTEAVPRALVSPCSGRLASPSASSFLPKAVGLPASDCPDVVARVSKEFWPILNMVHEKASQRFSHIREALRIVDADYDGCITRGEMQNFFRAFGVGEKESDRFYEALAGGGPGGANYHSFVQVVGPYLDLAGVVTAMQRSASRASRPGSASSRGHSTPRRVRAPDESCQRLILDRLPSRDEGRVASRNPSSPVKETRKTQTEHEKCLGGRVSPALRARVRESPRRMKPCKVLIATPSAPIQSPRHLVSAQEGRNAARAIRPLSPPPAVKKGGRRPLGILRKELDAEDCSNTMRAALRTNDGRPVATPARRPRSQGRTRCLSPQAF